MVKNIAELETEITNLPWTERKRQCTSQKQNWTTCLAYPKNVLHLSAVTDEKGHHLENEAESGRRLYE